VFYVRDQTAPVPEKLTAAAKLAAKEYFILYESVRPEGGTGARARESSLVGLVLTPREHAVGEESK
jgi:hypothetical protein